MTYVFRQGDLPRLDLQTDRGTDFKAWRAQWEAYLSLSGLDSETQSKQVKALTLCFSRETVTVVDNLGLTADQRGNAQATVEAISTYVAGQLNESVERRNFRRRCQQQGEAFDDFLVSLRELAKTCGFCSDACSQKSIRDQIIEGLVDGDTVENLLREKNLTLETTISKCRAQEAARKQRAEITGRAMGTSVVSHTNVQALRKQTTPPPNLKTCQGCGFSVHPGGRQQCPAINRKCNYCRKVGHLAKVCRAKRMQPHPPSYSALTLQADRSAELEEPSPEVNTSSVCSISFERAPTIMVSISSLNGLAMVEVLPDSGADICVAGVSLLQHLQELQDNLLPSNITPRAVNGSVMQPLGRLPVTITLMGRRCMEDFHIYSDVDRVLISWKAAHKLNILHDTYPHPIQPTLMPQVHAAQKAPSDSLQSEFPSVFDDNVKTMEGEVFHISLTEDAQPFCVRTPRTIPFAYRDKLKAELDHLQAQGIVAPVTVPTDWCAPIVVAPKKNSDKIRLCIDLSRLNRYVKRERYQSVTPAQAVADIASENAKIFTKLDALKGYHQCPLDEASQLLTTFITPFGRFKFLRAPYGISSISEHYNRRMDEAFSGLSGYRRVVDDAVIYDSDKEKHELHVRQFLQRCADKKITLNRDKWVYAKPEVEFAGFVLSADGYRVNGAITEAISKFPTPTTRSDLRSFIGLANQLSASTSTIASLLTPLRPLLSTKNEFLWTPDINEAFTVARQSLTSAPTLSFFDPLKDTRLCTDASRQGLGFVLQQKSGDNWVLVQAGSRFLSDTESRYAVIELELLAVSWAIVKCNVFLAGLPHFVVVTDHHPLVPILNSHRLDEIENPRLQRLRTRIMGYNFTAEWIKGSVNCMSDALSRYPTANPAPQEMLAEQDSNNEVEASITEIRAVVSSPHESLRLQDLRKHAEEDRTYQQLLHYIREGFPDHRSQLPEQCRAYWRARDQLSIDDDLVVYGCRLVVPTTLRKQVLSELHASHQGRLRTKQRAQLIVYWPGMDNEIDNLILGCKMCQDSLPSHPPEPITQKPRPTRPFQEIAVDFCSYAGRDFLVLVDTCTDWPDIVFMGSNTTTPRLVTALKKEFCRSGVPDVLWSDQGPQFTSKLFHDFTTEWGIKHVTSTPTYPQSNGKAEATVKSMKKLIQGSWTGSSVDEAKLARGMLQYRNTPSRRDGLSPAQKLFGHPIQDTLPAHRRAFAPEWQRSAEVADTTFKAHQEQVEQQYNTHTRALPEIGIGSNVAIQNSTSKLWDIYGVVVDVGPFRRYFVKTVSGRILVRNRRFLRRRVPLAPVEMDCPNSSSQPNPPLATVPPSNYHPRRSTRPRKRVKRLIEEINFN